MRYVATADTDIGISKDTNQDSVLIKHASTDKGEVLLAVVCDGMGGLSKGELASATVIRAFADWFDNELPFELENVDLNVIGAKWSLMLKELNAQILEYSKSNALEGVGTTNILSVMWETPESIILVLHLRSSRQIRPS